MPLFSDELIEGFVRMRNRVLRRRAMAALPARAGQCRGGLEPGSMEPAGVELETDLTARNCGVIGAGGDGYLVRFCKRSPRLELEIISVGTAV